MYKDDLTGSFNIQLNAKYRCFCKLKLFSFSKKYRIFIHIFYVLRFSRKTREMEIMKLNQKLKLRGGMPNSKAGVRVRLEQNPEGKPPGASLQAEKNKFSEYMFSHHDTLSKP